MQHIVLLLLCLGAMFGSLEGKNPWNAFVENPNAKNFGLCQKLLLEVTKDTSGNNITSLREMISRDGALTAVLKLVSTGNVRAMELCVQFYPIYRGWVSDIEDIDAALGRSVRIRPKAFLDLLDKYLKNSPRVPQIVCSLGEELVDDRDSQIDELKGRIQVLEHVPSGFHAELRKECIQALKMTVDLLESASIEKE